MGFTGEDRVIPKVCSLYFSFRALCRTLYIADRRDGKVHFLDSLKGSAEGDIVEFLDRNVQIIGGGPSWSLVIEREIAQQQNSRDCGVFVCAFVYYYIHSDLSKFKSEFAAEFRRYLGLVSLHFEEFKKHNCNFSWNFEEGRVNVVSD